MQKLRGVIKWLPTDEFDFSLERFADADITLPKPHNTTAPVERAAELVEEGDDVCILNALVGDIGLAFWVPLGLAAVVGYAMLRDDDTDARLNPA